MGLPRRAGPAAGVLLRPADQGQTTAEVPRRPGHRQVPGRCPATARPVRPTRDRDLGPHRHAQRRTARPHRRRRGPDRVGLLAADSGRQAPQRPLHPTAPAAEDHDRQLARGPARLARQPAAVHRPRPPDPRHPRRPRRPPGRRRGRHRARPPPPAAAHPGHPGHQPRHEPGSHRRPARPQDDDHDPGLRPDRRPDGRRAVLHRHREGRSALPATETRRATRRRRTRPDAETASRAPVADAGQRLLLTAS